MRMVMVPVIIAGKCDFPHWVSGKKTAGKDIKIGVSVDQIAADAIGDRTKLRSLELSCDEVRKSGKCDSGYSCACNTIFRGKRSLCPWFRSPILSWSLKGFW